MLTLTTEQIETYTRDGVLVVENLLSEEELKAAVDGLRQTLASHGVDTQNLHETGHHLCKLSSTHGSGGVLDLFYDEWKIQLIGTNSNLFHVTTQLWESAYCHDNNETKHDIYEQQQQQPYKWHPYGAFDCHKGYMYIDRIGYRLPTILAQEIGSKIASSSSGITSSLSSSATTTQQTTGNKKSKKSLSIQRSLTPHLDCCPTTFLSTTAANKWRPIQCFVALTDALEPNMGGFEAAVGFHHEFEDWSKHRPPTTIMTSSRSTKQNKKQQQQSSRNGSTKIALEIPAPCIGEYTHIRPVEDGDVLKRIRHVPVAAGSAVFWDNRIPHANSYRHNGNIPRAVVYCSFLPDVQINRIYCARQLEHWIAGQNPTDQWIQSPEGESQQDVDEPKNTDTQQKQKEHQLARIQTTLSTPLARRLAGLEPWDT